MRISSHTGKGFPVTQWSEIRRAGSRDAESADALNRLCRVYWPPIYAFVRRKGWSGHDAEDLTQGIFEKILKLDGLIDISPERGRFRTFLLGCAENFINDELRRLHAQKRDVKKVVALDTVQMDDISQDTFSDGMTPERCFNRQWALTLLAHAMDRLKVEFENRNRGELFEILKTCLESSRSVDEKYDILAERAKLTNEAFRAQVSRFRKKWASYVQEDVKATMDDTSPDALKEEMGFLMSCLNTGR